MRLRIRELLTEHDMTPYALSVSSGGRISMSTAYRLHRDDGRLRSFNADQLEALCDVFGVGPGELLERETRRRRKG